MRPINLFAAADLHFCVSQANLKHADISGAILDGANMDGADLRNAKFDSMAFTKSNDPNK